MIYLDHGATSWPKPKQTIAAMNRAMVRCSNPGRGGYPMAMEAAEILYRCRKRAAELFRCKPEQVVFTGNCTHGLNLAIRTLVKPGDHVVISGFEHNAVVRPLYALGAKITIAGRKLFSRADTLSDFERILKTHPTCAIFTHVSNVFGYVLPIEELARLCRHYSVPFIVDCAQSAGTMPLNFSELGADFLAMPGHKGLQGPLGTGLLLCGRLPEPWIAGGTGSLSAAPEMPDFLPDRAEAGTANVPGIAALEAGMTLVQKRGVPVIMKRERRCMIAAVEGLKSLGLHVFSGPDQLATVSFLPPDGDCEGGAMRLSRAGFCLRAGLHCAPVAHESAGTLDTGTIRLSCGPDTEEKQIYSFLRAVRGAFFEKGGFS